jgi:hypothetical protein
MEVQSSQLQHMVTMVVLVGFPAKLQAIKKNFWTKGKYHYEYYIVRLLPYESEQERVGFYGRGTVTRLYNYDLA